MTTGERLRTSKFK